jgi:protein TonB
LDDYLQTCATQRYALQGVQVTRHAISPAVNNESHENNATRSFESPAASDSVIFENVLLFSSIGQRNRRTWATVTSYLLLFLVIGFLLLLPLWFTEQLPKQQLLTFLEAPPPPPPSLPPPATPAPVKVVKVVSNTVNGRLRTPTRIPAKVQLIKEDAVSPPVATVGGVIGGVPGGIPGGQLGGVIGGILSSSSSVSAVPAVPKPLPTAQRVRVSQGVINGLLINRVEPTYPPLAQQAHIQGVVVLTAIIGKDGSVQHLQVVSGHPLLAPAAIAAVKQWRYKPYLLNGEPLEVDTTITVTFHVRS